MAREAVPSTQPRLGFRRDLRAEVSDGAAPAGFQSFRSFQSCPNVAGRAGSMQHVRRSLREESGGKGETVRSPRALDSSPGRWQPRRAPARPLRARVRRRRTAPPS